MSWGWIMSPAIAIPRPIDEATLAAALKRGRTMGQIASKYSVSVGDVADLIDLYDLDR